MKNPHTNPKWLFLPIGGVVAGSVLFLSGGLTSAQTPEPSPGPTGTTTTSSTADSQTYDDFLAEELGISVDELRSAQATARDRYIDSLVDAGELTAEQAANVKASSPGDALGHALGGNVGYLRDILVARVSQLMGIERQALEDGLDQGKSLDEIAQEQGINAEDVKTELRSGVDQLINLAQQVGLLSEEDATELRNSVQEFIDSAFSAGGMESSPTPVATP